MKNDVMRTSSQHEGLARPALVLFFFLTLVTGVLYPLLVTGIAQAVFPRAANGSLIMRGDVIAGSSLIGQAFSDPAYFWSRPSATGPLPYNASASSGANLGPMNPALIAAVQERIAALRAADPGNSAPVPIDLVTTSASGLDPHISLAAANYQAERVARERGVSIEIVTALITEHAKGKWAGWLGEARVNVLELNLDLDAQVPR